MSKKRDGLKVSEERYISEKVMDVLKSDYKGKTYLEIVNELYKDGFTDQQKNYIKKLFTRLKKRNLIEHTGEYRQRCGVYRPTNRGNMEFIKDSELNTLQSKAKVLKNLLYIYRDIAKDKLKLEKEDKRKIQTLFRERLDKNQITKFIGGDDNE